MEGDRGQQVALSVELLESAARVSVPVALAAATGGALVTADWRFAVGCLLGAGADVAAVLWIAQRAKAAPDLAAATSSIPISFVGGRVVLKAVVLVVAFVLPAYISLWGALCGVLVYDAVLVTAGSITSIRGSFPKFGARHF